MSRRNSKRGPSSRRSFLKRTLAGGLVLGASPLDRFLYADESGAAAIARSPRAEAIIHIHLPGGMAQQESFDSKPYAPSEYRGPFGSIPTKIDGVFFSDRFKKTAAIADRLTICRSMTHGEAAHERGTHNIFTGYRPSPALVYPSIGSVISHELGGRRNLPAYVCIPRLPSVYAGSGYLSSAHGPFNTGSDPASKNFEVKDLAVAKDVDDARFARRRRLLDLVDESFSEQHHDDATLAIDAFYERAYSLIESPEARAAFDLKSESAKTKKAYGENQPGMRMLLARRLAEAGVRYTTVSFGNWDHHDNIKAAMQNRAVEVDRAYSQLILDLDERGLLDTTLVLLTTEFGRTPKTNATDGRDHWPRVFSTLLAGGGIKRGFAYGTSDPLAAEPDEDPLTIERFATTIYHLIGIDAEKELIAPGNRPIEIVKGGAVVHDLLA